MRAPLAYALLAFAAPGLASAGARAAPATTAAADTAAPRAENAWVRLNAVPGRPAAGYLTIIGGSKADTLVGATAPGARIELHSMAMAGGVMAMNAIDRLPVPAGATVSFASGGNHLMIFGLPATAKSLPITLSFASGRKVAVTAAVHAAGDDVHGGH